MKRHVSRGITPEIQANLDYLATRKDEDVDLSDMPEVTDWTGWQRGKFYRPVKQQLTLRLDSDVVHWFKTHAEGAKGYQTKINAALRQFVDQEVKRRRRA